MYLDATAEETSTLGRFLVADGEMTKLLFQTLYWFKEAA